MNALRPGLPPLPDRMRRLPVDARGFPIPWFVHIDDAGVPDFRVVKRGAITEAWRDRKCWLCGGPLGSFVSFVIGPMCAVNRTSAEPPAHRDCAQFAAQACPFLVKPRMRRDESDHEEATGLPPGCVAPAGDMIRRNPGCCAIWTVRSSSPQAFRATGGILFDIGDPSDSKLGPGVEWWAEGRAATRAEVLASIDSGMPFLLDAVKSEMPDRRPRAIAELLRRAAAVNDLLPLGEARIEITDAERGMEIVQAVLA